MKFVESATKNHSRRSFLKRGVVAAGAATLGSGFLIDGVSALGEDRKSGRLTEGDAAILRFVAAAEILESDLWEQYWELSATPGTVTSGFASPNPATGTKPTPTGGNAQYNAALQILDGDMPQYINDNTDDEFSHANFLLAYLKSRGASTAELDLLLSPHFRTLAGSMATGSTKKGRLTNLTQLTIDTSFWGRYRSDDKNPDLGDTSFARPVPSLNIGKHTAIPRTDADASNADLINAIAFTAGFHFCFIEQGGTSLYPGLAQRAEDPEVLRILLSIGPTETMHFQTWQDKAGNANTNPNGPPARMMIDAGVDVNAADRSGLTPLMIGAGYNGNLRALKMLLAKGADVNAVSPPSMFARHMAGPVLIGSMTPLLMAAAFGPPELIKTLLDAGADVNAVDVRGMTPLMLAIATDRQDPAVIRMLLDHGAIITPKSKLGETAFDWARKIGLPAGLQLLGAQDEPDTRRAPTVAAKPAELRTAVERGVALMEKTSQRFFAGSGCISCHGQSNDRYVHG